jgi:hypothetical protein
MRNVDEGVMGQCHSGALHFNFVITKLTFEVYSLLDKEVMSSTAIKPVPPLPAFPNCYGSDLQVCTAYDFESSEANRDDDNDEDSMRNHYSIGICKS